MTIVSSALHAVSGFAQMMRCMLSVVPCLVLVAIGCGGPQRAEVTGQVTLRGKELTHGQVSFVGSDGQTVSAEITADGTYAAKGVLFGDNQVFVIQVDPNAKTPSEIRREIEQKRARPDALQYHKPLLPELEPIQTTITQKKTTFDILLRPKK